jgi:hypothetical protein
LNDSNGNCATAEVVLVRPPGKDCRELENFGAQKTLEPSRTNAEVLQDLATDSAKYLREKYYSLSNSATGQVVPDHGVSEPGGTVGDAIKPPTDGSMFVQVHGHDKGKIPMFSWDDLKTFRDLHNFRVGRMGSYDVNVTFILTTYTNQHYALKVEDFDKFNIFMESMDGSIYKTDLLNLKNKTTMNLEKFFLNVVADSGIQVYTMDNDGINDWNRLQLDNNNLPVEKPC